MSRDNAIWAAYNAAELKADEARNNCGPGPIDHAAQAALEKSELSGNAFDNAYTEVFETVHKLSENSETTDELATKVKRIRFELMDD